MANKVFEDRLGVWVISTGHLAQRLPAIKAFPIADVFLPRTANPEDFAAVRAAGCYAHLWVAVDGLGVTDFANRTLLDIGRLKPGATELNIELGSDAPLPGFIAEAVRLVRKVKPNMRLRVNVGLWKSFGLTAPAFRSDPNLYACMQTYAGQMEPYSQADAYSELTSVVPAEKATLCYGAAGPVPGSLGRVCTLPNLMRKRRGVIFHDDLMAEVGLLP